MKVISIDNVNNINVYDITIDEPYSKRYSYS